MAQIKEEVVDDGRVVVLVVDTPCSGGSGRRGSRPRRRCRVDGDPGTGLGSGLLLLPIGLYPHGTSNRSATGGGPGHRERRWSAVVSGAAGLGRDSLDEERSVRVPAPWSMDEVGLRTRSKNGTLGAVGTGVAIEVGTARTEETVSKHVRL